MRYAVGPLAALPMSDFGGGVPRPTGNGPSARATLCQLVPTFAMYNIHVLGDRAEECGACGFNDGLFICLGNSADANIVD
jgi:hypothetical protein